MDFSLFCILILLLKFYSFSTTSLCLFTLQQERVFQPYKGLIIFVFPGLYLAIFAFLCVLIFYISIKFVVYCIGLGVRGPSHSNCKIVDSALESLWIQISLLNLLIIWPWNNYLLLLNLVIISTFHIECLKYSRLSKTSENSPLPT